MNPQQGLEAVAEAIKNRTHSPTKTWAIVWSAGRFLCVPTNTSPLFEFTFGRLPDSVLEKGLDANQWNDLLIKIGVFLKQKGLI